MGTFDDQDSEDENKTKTGDFGLSFVIGFIVEDSQHDVDDGKNEQTVVKIEYFFKIKPRLATLFY
jgi:hypothetical protein